MVKLTTPSNANSSQYVPCGSMHGVASVNVKLLPEAVPAVAVPTQTTAPVG